MILKGGNAKILKAVMDAVIPRGGPFSYGTSDFNLLPLAESYLNAMDAVTRRMFLIILKQIEYTSFFYMGKRFTKLGREDASRFLDEMERSAFYVNRGALMLLKLLTTLAFFDVDEVTDQIGYRTDCSPEQEKGQ